MNRSDLVKVVSEKHDISSEQSREIIDFIFATIADTTSDGGEVSITGFGKFIQRKRDARVARNPRSGEEVTVDETVSVAFKPAKTLKERLSR
jgi:nucleoid DNA-binding protein